MIGDTARDILQKIIEGRGSEILPDEVTEFVEWLNAAQGSMNSVFDGRDKITALAEISQDSGDIVNGRIIAPAPEATSYEPSDTGFTGSFMSGQGETFTNISGQTFNAGAVAAGALQVGYNTSGQFVAGAGAVLIDTDGISVAVSSTLYDSNTIKFKYGTTVWGRIANLSFGGTLNNFYCVADGISGTDTEMNYLARYASGRYGDMWLGVQNVDDLTDGSIIRILAGSLGNKVYVNYLGKDVDTIIKGDATDVLTVDAGLDAVGIGGAAESGFPLKVTGNTKITGTVAASNLGTETSFTPTIVGTTNAGTGTYTTQTGTYKIIDNIVFFSATIVWTAHTGTGNMRVSGLPVTVAAPSPAVSISWSNITLAAVGNKIIGNASGTQVLLQEIGSGAASDLALDTAGTLRVTGFYFK